LTLKIKDRDMIWFPGYGLYGKVIRVRGEKCLVLFSGTRKSKWLTMEEFCDNIEEALQQDK